MSPSSFVLRPSSFVLRPSSFVLRPSSFVLRPSSFVVLLLASGCLPGTDYGLHVLPPEWVDLTCAPEEFDVAYPQSTQSDKNMGASVAILRTGPTTANQAGYRWAAAGLPDRSSGTNTGGVRILAADKVDGGFQYPGHADHQWIAAPRGARNFGSALLGVDLRDCVKTNGVMVACGEELLVGSPDSTALSTAGRFGMYQTTAAGKIFGLGQGVAAPSGMAAGAQFGSAFAAWGPPNTGTAWSKAPAAHWVAVGAPGADRVAIYRVAASTSAPLQLMGVVQAPVTLTDNLNLKGFGTALTAGDFNGDGLGDLAVGAPISNKGVGGSNEGKVAIFLGTAAGPYAAGAAIPLNLAQPILISGDVEKADAFGAALASGRVRGAEDAETGDWLLGDQDSLVVGAPNTPYYFGGAWHYGLGSAYIFDLVYRPALGGWIGEYEKSRMLSPDYRFGSSVAVGNFLATDSVQRRDTDAARAEEIAVGVPGYRIYNSDDFPSYGAVWVYAGTQDRGSPWNALGAVVTHRDPYLRGLGNAIASGYIQDLPWEDLLLGFPDAAVYGTEDGAVLVTKAQSTANSDCDAMDGLWEVADGSGAGVQVMSNAVLHYTQVSFQGAVSWPMHIDGDLAKPACPPVEIPDGFSFELNPEYGCPVTCAAQRWSDLPVLPLVESLMAQHGVELSNAEALLLGSASLDWEMTYQGAGSACSDMNDHLLLELALEPAALWAAYAMVAEGVDADCRPIPLQLDLLTTGVCE